MRKDTKTTAAEMLEASRKLDIEEDPFPQCNNFVFNYLILILLNCILCIKLIDLI